MTMAAAVLVPASAHASIIYTFTATSAECLVCGNTSPEPLSSFTLVVPGFVAGSNTIPQVNFLAGNNLGASTYLLAGGSGAAGHDTVTIVNSYGSYNYDFAAGTLSKVGGPTSAVVGAFDGFSQSGVVTITDSNPAPEPSTALLFAVPTAAFCLWRRRARIWTEDKG
jgi:hypothetical protein